MAADDADLLAAQAAYLQAWNEALHTGDPGAVLRFLSPRLRSWFMAPGMAAPATDGAAGYAESTRDAIGYLGRTARWSCDSVITAMRSSQEGVLACRYVLRRGDRADPELLLSVWRREGEQWRLERVYEEVGLPHGQAPAGLPDAHAAYAAAWNRALSGDPHTAGALAGWWSPDGQALAGAPDHDQPAARPLAAYAAQLLERWRGGRWQVTARIVAGRGPDEGLVAAHGVFSRRTARQAILRLEVWRREPAGWRLHRSYAESQDPETSRR